VMAVTFILKIYGRAPLNKPYWACADSEAAEERIGKK